MTTGRQLLPPNRTPWEAALADVLAKVFDTPDPLDLLTNPELCPAAFLPWLAATFSVDVWDATWDVAKQRQVIAAAVIDHRFKGTLYTIERYAGYRGGTIHRVVRPPQKFYASSSISPAEREAWIARLPQIRLFVQGARSPRSPAIIAGGGAKPFFPAQRFALPNAAPARAGERAVLWKDGIETPIGTGIWQGNTVLTISARGRRTRRLHAGRSVGAFASPSVAASHVYVVDLSSSGELTPVFPGGRLQTTRPEIVAGGGVARRRWFAGALAHRRFTEPSDAASRVYKRIPIVDADSPAQPRKSVSFASWTRVAVADHTAELSVEIPGKGSRLKFCAARPAGLYAFPSIAAERIRPVKTAVLAGKRLSDTLFMNTNLHRPLTAGAELFAGQVYRAGSWTL